MLKISKQQVGGCVRLELSGKLAGPWVAELERCWRSPDIQEGNPLSVDLSSVTFIDDGGKELLAAMCREHVTLVAKGCLNSCIVDRIVRSQQTA